MITELQARRMTNEQVLEVLKKSCERYNEKLICAQYNPETLELTVLLDAVKDDGAVEMDMEGVLIGLYDFDFNYVDDDVLELQDEPYCPTVSATCDTDIYYGLVKAMGGVVLL